MKRLYMPRLLEQTKTSTSSTPPFVWLKDAQAHYVLNVMRLKKGQKLLLFHEAVGEFEALIADTKRNTVKLTLSRLARPPLHNKTKIVLYFSPLKQQPLSYLVGKATESGVTHFVPCVCERTVVKNVNIERMKKLAIEATEQSGRITPPCFAELKPLKTHIQLTCQNRHYILLDIGRLPSLLRYLIPKQKVLESAYHLLLGPEGGWGTEDRTLFNTVAHTRVSLGPHTLRAETAGALAVGMVSQCVQDT